MTITWQPAALADLKSIRLHIARDAPASADVVAQRIVEAVRTLAEFPRQGRPGRAPGTRELVVPRTPYLVAYYLHDDIVETLRVIHGSQRWPML